jgi:hypothetical protein
LLASGNQNRRPKEKHYIRRFLHPQLRRLWHTNENLKLLAAMKYFKKYSITQMELDDKSFGDGLRIIGKNWSRAGYELVPLVTPEHALRCSLDILLLRPGEDKFIFKMGDIDGQLKTLFDGLKIPDSEAETGNSPPQNDETPFFCLLQDDRLITDVHVTTDQLLLLPNHKEVTANDAFVVIDVKLNPKYSGTYDNYF